MLLNPVNLPQENLPIPSPVVPIPIMFAFGSTLAIKSALFAVLLIEFIWYILSKNVAPIPKGVPCAVCEVTPDPTEVSKI